jgi:hypothetical protein
LLVFFTFVGLFVLFLFVFFVHFPLTAFLIILWVYFSFCYCSIPYWQLSINSESDLFVFLCCFNTMWNKPQYVYVKFAYL